MITQQQIDMILITQKLLGMDKPIVIYDGEGIDSTIFVTSSAWSYQLSKERLEVWPTVIPKGMLIGYIVAFPDGDRYRITGGRPECLYMRKCA